MGLNDYLNSSMDAQPLGTKVWRKYRSIIGPKFWADLRLVGGPVLVWLNVRSSWSLRQLQLYIWFKSTFKSSRLTYKCQGNGFPCFNKPAAQAAGQTLPDATPMLGKIPPFTKIAVTCGTIKRFKYPLRFRLSVKKKI